MPRLSYRYRSGASLRRQDCGFARTSLTVTAMASSFLSQLRSVPRWVLALTLLLALGILWGTLKPPGTGGGSFPLNDKQIHALAFGLLVFPLSAAASRLIPRLAVTALIFGAVIEVIQPAFGRSGEFADLLADAVGIGAGSLLGFWISRKIGARKTRSEL